MTTATEIVRQALREGNLIPVGTTPTTDQLSEALERLNVLILGFLGDEIGEPLAEWMAPPPQQTAPVDARYPLFPGQSQDEVRAPDAYLYPPNNVRLIASNTAALTLYLQHLPNDGARIGYTAVGATQPLTLDGNGRRIAGSPTISVSPTDNGGVRLWFYRSDLGQWTEIVELTATSQSPLPREFDDFLVSALAIRLSSLYGNEPRSGTLLTYKNMMRKVKARYRQPTASLGNSGAIPNTYQAFPQTGLLGGAL